MKAPRSKTRQPQILVRRLKNAGLGGFCLLASWIVTAAESEPMPDSIASTDKSRTPLALAVHKAFEEGKFKGLHGLLVQVQGETLAEIYFSGGDESWGKPLGLVEHTPDTLHDLRSVTKSVVSLLYGIALDKGLVPPPDAKLLEQFPDYADLAAAPGWDQITVEDLLSMRMGIEWNEAGPYTNAANSEIAMELAEDRFRFIFSRPVDHQPGTQWTYNGGATALLARLIENGSGKPIDDFARTWLFAPLGIRDFEWAKGKDGVHSAASGLRLTLPDLARIGQLILDHGRVGNRQIVSEDWLERSFHPRVTLEGGFLRYGYQWWLAGQGEPPYWAAGFGNGGQRLTIEQKAGLVIAIQAGNYNQPEDWRLPAGLIDAYVIPAVREHFKRSNSNAAK